jgi:hypothetical protein
MIAVAACGRLWLVGGVKSIEISALSLGNISSDLDESVSRMT